MVLLDTISCNNSFEAKAKVNDYITLLNATLNIPNKHYFPETEFIINYKQLCKFKKEHNLSPFTDWCQKILKANEQFVLNKVGNLCN
jgi:hypothetical protein